MMSENAPPESTPTVADASYSNTGHDTGRDPVSTHNGTRRPARFNNRYGNVTRSTPRDFEGDTPKLGGILGLRSKSIIKKINYDLFYEKQTGNVYDDGVQKR